MLEIKEIVCSDLHAFFITHNDKAYACGCNKYGQLGVGDSKDKDKPTPVKLPENGKLVKIIAGKSHSFFLFENGNVYACGKNDCGQLGREDFKKQHTLVPVTTIPYWEELKNISAGRDYSIFEFQKDKWYACGNNESGFLFIDNKYIKLPELTEITFNKGSIKQIVCGSFRGFLLCKSGDLYCRRDCHSGTYNGPQLCSKNMEEMFKLKSSILFLDKNDVRYFYGVVGGVVTFYKVSPAKKNYKNDNKTLHVTQTLRHEYAYAIYPDNFVITSELNKNDHSQRHEKISQKKLPSSIMKVYGNDSPFAFIILDNGSIYHIGRKIIGFSRKNTDMYNHSPTLMNGIRFLSKKEKTSKRN